MDWGAPNNFLIYYKYFMALLNNIFIIYIDSWTMVMKINLNSSLNFRGDVNR